MSTANRELAKQASRIARASDGMQRRAAGYAVMALASTEETAAAKATLGELWPPISP